MSHNRILSLVKNTLFAILLIGLIIRPVIDYDIWWHILAGDAIRKTNSVPQSDIFTYSLPDYPYIYHSWATEVILSVINQIFGFPGLSVFFAAVIALSLFILTKPVLTPYGLSGWLSLLAVAPLAGYTVYARTQAVSFLFLTVVNLIFLSFRNGRLKYSAAIISLSVILAVWANLHGGFILGILLIAILSFQEMFAVRRFIKKFLVLMFLPALATILNPYGYRVYRQAIAMAVSPDIAAINLDWQPLFSPAAGTYLSAILITGYFFLAVIAAKKSNRETKALIILTYILTLLSRRYVLLLLVFSTPPVAGYLAGKLSLLFPRGRKMLPVYLPIYFALACYFLTFILRIPVTLLDIETLGRDPEYYASRGKPIVFPYRATDYLRQTEKPERILNDFHWGGYLKYHLPDIPIFVYSAMDAYFVDNRSFAAIYYDLIHQRPGWESTWGNYQFDAILGPSEPEWEIATWARTQPGWKEVFRDEVSVLLIKTL